MQETWDRWCVVAEKTVTVIVAVVHWIGGERVVNDGSNVRVWVEERG